MTAFDTARTALGRAVNVEIRTKLATTACNEAFTALEQQARELKRRFFHIPPLTPEDIAALGLKEPAWGAGPLGDPTAEIQAQPSIQGVGYHQIRIDIVAISEDINSRNNYGNFHIKYGVFDPGAAPPRSYKDLHDDIYSQRKKEFLNLETDDSGKSVLLRPHRTRQP